MYKILTSSNIIYCCSRSAENHEVARANPFAVLTAAVSSEAGAKY